MSKIKVIFTVRLPGNTFREDGIFSKIAEKYTDEPSQEDYYSVEVWSGENNFDDVFCFFQIAGELTKEYKDTEITVSVYGEFGNSEVYILPDEGRIESFLRINTDKLNDFKKDKLRNIRKIIDELC